MTLVAPSPMFRSNTTRSAKDGPPGAGHVSATAALVVPAKQGWRAMLRDWLRRYGPAECAGVCGALIGSFGARRLTGSTVAAAYGGAWGESIGYASVMILRDFLTARRAAHGMDRKAGARVAAGVATGLLTEFGPAALLDTIVIRPAAMGVGMRLIGPRGGLVAGKCVADVLFYLPVILMYERRKRAARRSKS